MMSATELLTAVRDAWVTDQDLLDWCRDQFGRAPTVQIGLDDARPPDDDHYPIVALPGLSRRGGMGSRDIVWRLEVGVAVLQPGIEQQGQATTYAGLLQVERLRELAESAIFQAGLGALSTDGESGSYCAHPIYVSYGVLQITERKPSTGRR